MTAPIPAIGYIRVSRERGEMITTDIQRSAIASWAAREGRQIIAWVEDLDQSGRNFKRRVISAIERIERREAAEIVVYRYDRWGRNAVESLANIKRVEMVGGNIQSATEPLDAETTIGRYSRTNALAMAEMQSDTIGDNWKAALENRVERGLPGQGTKRFGYIRLGRTLDPLADPRRPAYRRDPNDTLGERYEPDYEGGTADALVEMYDMYISGSGYRQIALWLHSEGFLNARGNPWSTTGVRSTLRTGFAAGLLHLHRRGCGCDRPDTCHNWEYVDGAHVPVLDGGERGGETWQAYLAAQKTRARLGPRAKVATYPETGLVVCGRCHGHYAAINGNGGVNGYMMRCLTKARTAQCQDSPYVRRSVIGDLLLESVTRWVADIEAGAAIEGPAQAARGRAESDATRLARELADKDAALVRLMTMRAEDGGATPASIWDASRDKLLAERADLERRLTGASEAAAEPTMATYAPVLVRLLDGWALWLPAERRSLLGQVIRHVTVLGAKGALDLRVTPMWEPCECPRCT